MSAESRYWAGMAYSYTGQALRGDPYPEGSASWEDRAIYAAACAEAAAALEAEEEAQLAAKVAEDERLRRGGA